jgi:hypothetical protein
VYIRVDKNKIITSYKMIMFVRSNLLWLFGIILIIAYFSTILKITEPFRNSKRKFRNKKKKTKKYGGKLKIKDNNVSIPNDVSVEFGAKVGGKEVNAGKIRYGGWDSGALNIVGAGDNGVNRKVRLWDKLQVGPLEVQENGCIGYGLDKKFTFCFQKDGNVVQYKDKKPVWATGIPS